MKRKRKKYRELAIGLRKGEKIISRILVRVDKDYYAKTHLSALLRMLNSLREYGIEVVVDEVLV